MAVGGIGISGDPSRCGVRGDRIVASHHVGLQVGMIHIDPFVDDCHHDGR